MSEGYAFVVSPCFGCGRPFAYNPLRVPSIRPSPDAPREPICKACVDRANPMRIANGLPPIEPMQDAYEPVAESELHV